MEAEDLGTDMYLVPSLLVYLAVAFGIGVGVGDAAATAAAVAAACCRLLLAGMWTAEMDHNPRQAGGMQESGRQAKAVGGKVECDLLSNKERNLHWRGMQAQERPRERE